MRERRTATAPEPAHAGPAVARVVHGIQLLRRSLQLRAACGARPQVTAAQVALAEALGSGPEADELREIAGATAVDLGLTWLLPKGESS